MRNQLLFYRLVRYLLFAGIFALVALQGMAQGTSPATPPQTIANTLTGNNAEPALFNDVNLSYFELVSANLQVSKESNLQKVVFLPLMLLPVTALKNLNFLKSTKVNVAQKDGLSTLGFGLGFDDSSPYSKRDRDLLAKVPSVPTVDVNTIAVPGMRGRDSLETFAHYQAFLQQREAQIQLHTTENTRIAQQQTQFDVAARQRFINYYRSLLRHSLRVTVGGNISFFEVLGGDKVDLNQDKLIDNYYQRAGRDVSLVLNYTFCETFSISGSIRQQLNRAKPIEGTQLVTYHGRSLGAALRIFTLTSRPTYEASEEYYRNLFVPCVVLGATAEYLKATENELAAKDGITQALVVTPFLDFRISSKSQFRIGVPIKRYQAVANAVVLGPFLQYNLQLTSPN